MGSQGLRNILRGDDSAGEKNLDCTVLFVLIIDIFTWLTLTLVATWMCGVKVQKSNIADKKVCRVTGETHLEN